jgi:hypothetical protein
MGNFELFKVSGKLDLNQVDQIYYTPESAFIELNPVGLAMKIIIMLVHLNQKNIQLNIKFEQCRSTQFS